MNCCYRCGLPATYYIENKKEWACDKIPQKCPSVKSKIGKSNSIALKGRTATETQKEALARSRVGRVVPQDVRDRISKSNIETKNKMDIIPWNKGKKGLQVAWNKGLKKQESAEVLSRTDPAYSDFRKYRNRVAVRTRKTYELFKEEINPQNLPLGKCGIDGAYQIDHIITVRMGFEQGLLIEDISSKENLRIIPWLENIKKYDGKGLRK